MVPRTRAINFRLNCPRGSWVVMTSGLRSSGTAATPVSVAICGPARQRLSRRRPACYDQAGEVPRLARRASVMSWVRVAVVPAVLLLACLHAPLHAGDDADPADLNALRAG